MELFADVELIHSEATLALRANANVTIFTSLMGYERVSPFFETRLNDCHWVIKPEKDSLSRFLTKVERYCDEKIDLLFLNTFYVLPHQQLLYYFFRPKCTTVQVACRVESWFGELQPIRNKSAKTFILSVLHNISQLIRWRTLPHFNGLWVENRDAYDYAVSKGYKKSLTCNPLLFYTQKKNYQSYNEKLKCITIGTINDQRRDYDGLLDCFEKLFDSGMKNVSLTLLGAPVDDAGLRIINRCDNLIEKGLDLNYYTEYVHEEIVSQKIASADIIINPNKLGLYGTGTFGAIIKAMQFAKPGIYPINSLHHKNLASSSLFYHKIEELSGIIESLLNSPQKIERLSKNARENSEKFSLERVSKEFQTCVLEKYLTGL